VYNDNDFPGKRHGRIRLLRLRKNLPNPADQGGRRSNLRHLHPLLGGTPSAKDFGSPGLPPDVEIVGLRGQALA
jgi:hypothetical protein